MFLSGFRKTFWMVHTLATLQLSLQFGGKNVGVPVLFYSLILQESFGGQIIHLSGMLSAKATRYLILLHHAFVSSYFR